MKEQIKDEVYTSFKPYNTFDLQDLAFLKEKSKKTSKKRSRICFHSNNASEQQDMLICLGQDSVISPAFHSFKSETITVVEGSALIFFFSLQGLVLDFYSLSKNLEMDKMFCRIAAGTVHCIVPTSEFFIFIESTKGPFNSLGTVIPSWAPKETDTEKSLAYRKHLFDFAATKLL